MPPINLWPGQHLSTLHPDFQPDWLNIAAASGHRSVEAENTAERQYPLTALARHMLLSLRPSAVISGMALGWDLAIAEAALANDFPLICAVPHWGQCKNFPTEQLDRWKRCINNCQWLHVNNPVYQPDIYLQRNNWMINNCNSVLALLDPSATQGGTRYTIDLARSKGKKITNAWTMWQTDLRRLEKKESK